jgi:hypothetical protein
MEFDMTRRPQISLDQLELPLRTPTPGRDELRKRLADHPKFRKDLEYRRLLRESRVEFEQRPN